MVWLVCLLGTLPSAQAQNLVVNGTFPVASTDGWEKVGYSGGYVNEPFSAQGGTGDWINFTGTLAQNLNTVPGQWYVLSFATTGLNPSHGTQPCRLRVFWDAQLVTHYVMPNGPPWHYPKFLLRAEGPITRLTFEGFDYPNLDDIVVSPAAGTEPRIHLAQPAQNASVVAFTNMTLAAVVEVAPFQTVRRVEFFHTGINRLGSNSTAPYTVSWNRVPPGEYVVSARVTDSTGATMTSTGVTVFVESNPTMRIQSPVNGTAFTNGSAIGIRGTAANNNGKISRVEFSSEGNLLEAIANIPPNVVSEVSTIWSNAPEGNFTLSLAGVDALGQSLAQTSVTVHVMPPGVVDVSQPEHALTVRVGGPFEYGQTFSATANGRLRQLDVLGNAIAFWDVQPMRAVIVEMTGDVPGTNVLGISELPSSRIDPIVRTNYSIYFPSNKVFLHAGRRYAALFSTPSNSPGMLLAMQPNGTYAGGTLLQKSPVRGWAPPSRIFISSWH